MPTTERFTWSQFDAAVGVLSMQIKKSHQFKHFRNIYGIPRGGLILAVALSHQFDLPIITDELDTYPIRTLIVDDISDSGTTLRKFEGFDIATLHVVKNTLVVPRWFYTERTKDWVEYPWETKK